MSGSTYDSTCPRCDGVMVCSEDRKPHDQVAGSCLNCGYEYYTMDGQISLEEVNEMRIEYGLPPLSELCGPSKEWLKSPYG